LLAWQLCFRRIGNKEKEMNSEKDIPPPRFYSTQKKQEGEQRMKIKERKLFGSKPNKLKWFKE
jgi:hypothetical protein